jgi:hypothetical protein
MIIGFPPRHINVNLKNFRSWERLAAAISLLALRPLSRLQAALTTKAIKKRLFNSSVSKETPHKKKIKDFLSEIAAYAPLAGNYPTQVPISSKKCHFNPITDKKSSKRR